MKQKTDVSLKMILQFFDLLIVQYEVSIFWNLPYILGVSLAELEADDKIIREITLIFD